MHGRTRVKYVEADRDWKVRLMDEMEKQSCMDVPEPNEYSVEDRSRHCEQVGQIEEKLVSWTALRLDKYCLFCSTRRFLNSPVPLVCCSIGTSVGIPART